MQIQIQKIFAALCMLENKLLLKEGGVEYVYIEKYIPLQKNKIILVFFRSKPGHKE